MVTHINIRHLLQFVAVNSYSISNEGGTGNSISFVRNNRSLVTAWLVFPLSHRFSNSLTHSLGLSFFFDAYSLSSSGL